MAQWTLDRCLNIADLQRVARRRLPTPVLDYLDGGADDEITLRRNSTAFADYELLPDVLVDVTAVRTATRLFGRDIAWPLMLSPTGLSQIFHVAGELAVARAAGQAGLPYALSTMGTATIEDVSRAGDGPKLFQVYVFKDRGLTADLIRRAKAAGYDGLIVTVDTAVPGNRERDKRNGLSVPLKFSLANMLGFARTPLWSLSALMRDPFQLVNVSASLKEGSANHTSLFEFASRQFDRSLTWADVETVASEWNGPLAVKGLMTPNDAMRARAAGATAVMISNHGGRQLDGAPAPADQVQPVADAVGGTMEIILDGGVRRGSDVIKALALGATACAIGRPYLYGLIAGGEAGVSRALSILHDEFARTLALLGLNDVANLGARHVRRRIGSLPSA